VVGDELKRARTSSYIATGLVGLPTIPLPSKDIVALGAESAEAFHVVSQSFES
jgi:hypothetical protein